MPNKKQYPYQNFSLEDINGEQWADIPFLDGAYLISTYGRGTNRHTSFQYQRCIKSGNNYTENFLWHLGENQGTVEIRDQTADGKWTEAVGEGTIDFPGVAKALKAINYSGNAAVEPRL